MAILGVVVIAIIIVAAPSSTGEAKRNDKKKNCVSYVIYSEFWFNIVMKTGGVNAALSVGDMSAVAFAFDEAFFYALLLIVGGAIGFVQAKSKPSLIAGTLSGVLVFAAAELGSSYDNLTGLFCLAAIALILTVFFYSRYVKTRKFMPAGLMCVISALSFCVYFYAVVV
ncbi:transmembrane protein 14, putative [Perkinsus marinus ATCC 50983]|uniref:Transmembrane protein 14, putative n=1 Tax=Perkinsus marinus (strain ATCC 50983 / TXsc) TaxID=423536 RepID=C5LYP4_PERM5|nr:transmembrane protein 14, putative [Perkinsus marinus ATCC 50983]EEQ98148.1 transmembrane protein 14, putative [Perkinsus marinus ATCC 50983]|eukprot:XP_002765431.1 transmembrane protein 14, putative [Perkinsus marinus ATCC 50983]